MVMQGSSRASASDCRARTQGTRSYGKASGDSPRRLKQLNRVARWVLEDDLCASGSAYNLLCAKRHACLTQASHLGREITDLEVNPIPAT